MTQIREDIAIYKKQIDRFFARVTWNNCSQNDLPSNKSILTELSVAGIKNEPAENEVWKASLVKKAIQ